LRTNPRAPRTRGAPNTLAPAGGARALRLHAVAEPDSGRLLTLAGGRCAPPIVIRTVVILAILASVWYLSWRTMHITEGTLWLGVPLFICEAYAALRLWNLAFVAWTVKPTRRPPLHGTPSVDVFVPTYNESEEVLRSTLTGCAAIDYPNYRVWVLDDGRREWVRRLAERYGAEYLTRPDNDHAKAGNINAAIPRTNGELILSLDADHVPQPEVLQALVGYFADPRLAMVQTPHEFYNRDSVQHAEEDHHEQSFFFHLIQPGRDAHGAAFWCGSGAVIRRTALVEAGGLSTATITEDFHTSLVIHGAGWTSRFHDEALVYGIAPHNLEQFILQRYRWSAGNLAALWTLHSPLRRNKLTLRQRWCYMAGLIDQMATLVKAVMISIVAGTLISGELPIYAQPISFAIHFVPWLVGSLSASILLGRGWLRIGFAGRFESYATSAQLRALIALVRPDARFKVTPKDGIDQGGWGWARCNMEMLAIAGLIVFALIWRAAVVADIAPGHRLPPFALLVASVASAYELQRLVRAANSLRSHVQLRHSYRTPADLRARIGAHGPELTVADLSSQGASLMAGPGAALPELAGPVPLVIDFGLLGAQRYEFSPTGKFGNRIGGRLRPQSDAAQRALDAAVFVIAPRTKYIDRESVTSQTAATLAGRLVGTATPARAREVIRLAA
jgi:cellulose synthase (UDP-forming)